MSENGLLKVLHHPWTLRIVTAVVTGAGMGYLLFPAGSIESRACIAIVCLGAAFGVSSPGLRTPRAVDQDGPKP